MVVRYNITIKRVFPLVMRDLGQKKIEQVCIVMYDNRHSRDQYGYGYGYKNNAGKMKRR